MKGTRALNARIGSGGSDQSFDNLVSPDRSRTALRDFLKRLLHEEPADNSNIPISLPPVLPFGGEEPNENTGFVVML